MLECLKLWFVLSSSFILRVLPTYHPVLFSRLIGIYCLFPHLYLQLDLDVCTTYLITISKFTFHSAYFSVYLHILDFSNIPHLNLRCFFLPSDLGHIISRVILDSSLSLTILTTEPCLYSLQVYPDFLHFPPSAFLLETTFNNLQLSFFFLSSLFSFP